MKCPYCSHEMYVVDSRKLSNKSVEIEYKCDACEQRRNELQKIKTVSCQYCSGTATLLTNIAETRPQKDTHGKLQYRCATCTQITKVKG